MFVLFWYMADTVFSNAVALRFQNLCISPAVPDACRDDIFSRFTTSQVDHQPFKREAMITWKPKESNFMLLYHKTERGNLKTEGGLSLVNTMTVEVGNISSTVLFLHGQNVPMLSKKEILLHSECPSNTCLLGNLTIDGYKTDQERLQFWVFDILTYNGTILNDHSPAKRQMFLDNIFGNKWTPELLLRQSVWDDCTEARAQLDHGSSFRNLLRHSPHFILTLGNASLTPKLSYILQK